MDEVLINILCDELGDPKGPVTRLHILRNIPIREVAAELRLGERTVNRHWRNTRTQLREDLGQD
jgi:DNA-directed RNA polymerase specialized sigma24 family protein